MKVSDSRVPAVAPTGRMEAFSDGVFAIAITLLVIEIHVPKPEGGVLHPLAESLMTDWPSYLSYLLSFVTIGIYWLNHHYLVRLFRGTTHVMNLLNLLLLFFISFIPFPTEILSEYLRQPGQERLAVMVYVGSLFAPSVAWLLIWVYAKKHKLLDPNLQPSFVRFLNRQYLLSPVIHVGAVVMALWSYQAGLAVCAGITGLYLMSPKRPEYVDASLARE